MAAPIEFTDEQSMLLETAADFCRNHSPIGAVRAAIDREESVDPALWQQMIELGWLGINIPADNGGLGLGLAEVVPIVESMGRYLLASPFIATVLAAEAIRTSASDTQKQQWLGRIASGAAATLAVTEDDGNWRLGEIAATGTRRDGEIALAGGKCFVLDAPATEVIVTSVNIDGEARLVAIDRSLVPSGALRREAVIDETRRSYRLELDGITIPDDQLFPQTDLRAIEHSALLLLGAEMSGGMNGVLHVVVDYLKTRKQFDKYIGSYQALKHPTVEVLLAMETCRSHLYRAATTMAGDDYLEKEIAVRMLKAQASESFAWAGDRAIQFHGGFGFTYECDAQLYLRRALWCQYQFGDERYQRQLLAPLLLGQVDEEKIQ